MIKHILPIYLIVFLFGSVVNAADLIQDGDPNSKTRTTINELITAHNNAVVPPHTQAISTVTGLQAALDDKVDTSAQKELVAGSGVTLVENATQVILSTTAVGGAAGVTEVPTLPGTLVDDTLYAAIDTGDLTYKSTTGIYTLAGAYVADPVNYSLTLDLVDGNGTDKVTISSTDYTVDTTISDLSGTVVATCTADTGRSCVGSGTGVTDNGGGSFTVDMSANRTAQFAFSASGGGSLVDEDFSGTSIPSGWTVLTGSPDFSVDGEVSLLYGDRIYSPAFAPQDTVYFAAEIEYTSLGAVSTVIGFNSASDLSQAYISMRADNRERFYNGSTYIGALSSVSVGTVYYWLSYDINGNYSFRKGTTSVYADSSLIGSKTDGENNSPVTYFYLAQSGDLGGALKVKKAILSNTPIGDL